MNYDALSASFFDSTLNLSDESTGSMAAAVVMVEKSCEKKTQLGAADVFLD